MFSRQQLQLHFDINQTIMVSDPAIGLGTKEGLNILIAKAAYLKRKDGTPLKQLKPVGNDELLCWHDNSPCNLGERNYAKVKGVPALLRTIVRVSKTTETPDSVHFIGTVPEGCISYYDLYGRDVSKNFTSKGAGKIFLPFLGDLVRFVSWPSDFPDVPDLQVDEGGVKYHKILPSFFHMLVRLKLSQRKFQLVLRTMGSDLDHIAKAIDTFAHDRHPLFHDSCKYITCADLMFTGRVHWRLERGTGSDMRLVSGRDDVGDVVGEEEIFNFLCKSEQAVGIKDDYEHWKADNWLPKSGKPLWFDVENTGLHPILFDDNIHYKEDDSIVAVRVRTNSSQNFSPVSGEVTMRLHNVILVKADDIQAILDPLYFLNCVEQCEENLAKVRLQSGWLEDTL